VTGTSPPSNPLFQFRSKPSVSADLRLGQRAVEIDVELIILQQDQRVELIIEPCHLDAP
jgi:hypothetical protein